MGWACLDDDDRHGTGSSRRRRPGVRRGHRPTAALRWRGRPRPAGRHLGVGRHLLGGDREQRAATPPVRQPHDAGPGGRRHPAPGRPLGRRRCGRLPRRHVAMARRDVVRGHRGGRSGTARQFAGRLGRARRRHRHGRRRVGHGHAVRRGHVGLDGQVDASGDVVGTQPAERARASPSTRHGRCWSSSAGSASRVGARPWTSGSSTIVAGGRCCPPRGDHDRPCCGRCVRECRQHRGPIPSEPSVADQISR